MQAIPTIRKEGIAMSNDNTFLAVFLGSKTSSKMSEWNALHEDERRARQQKGMAAWKA
jgi:hypothetical protein